MNERDFWYVAAEAKNVTASKAQSVKILDEWIALFRDENGKAVALKDRCLHRGVRLSAGTLEKGGLRCSYHGWKYNSKGEVVNIPSEGPEQPKGKCRQQVSYAVCECDDLVFVCLSGSPALPEPFRSPYYNQKGWRTQRLVNRFANNVTNCAENFVDVPHTTFVHPKIFRDPEGHRLTLEILRENGSVRVDYLNEKHSLGLFGWFLNPKKEAYGHVDWFHMPNVTSVEYHFSSTKHFYITSQSVPTSASESLVFTDLTYHYGLWNVVAGPVVRWLGQKVIDQDLDILRNQTETLNKYPEPFQNSGADLVHVLIESVRDALLRGEDPRLLPPKKQRIEVVV